MASLHSTRQAGTKDDKDSSLLREDERMLAAELEPEPELELEPELEEPKSIRLLESKLLLLPTDELRPLAPEEPPGKDKESADDPPMVPALLEKSRSLLASDIRELNSFFA